MTYTYKCKQCDIKSSIDKPMAESDRQEFCDKCGEQLVRVYEAPCIATSDGTKS